MHMQQNNSGLTEIAKQLLAFDSFVLCGHISPDGDCIGSQLALGHALRALGKRVHFILARNDVIDRSLMFLPGINELVPADEFSGRADAFVACDVSISSRIAQGMQVRERCDVSFTIDHHESSNADKSFTYSYLDPSSPSTTMLIWELIGQLGIKRDANMALCAYTGLVTDTGGFRFQNTTSAAFMAASEMVATGIEPALVAREVFQSRRQASLQLEALAIERMIVSEDASFVISYLLLEDFEKYNANKSDSEPIVNALRSVTGIKVACMLREQENEVRGSFRAKDHTDVAALAKKFQGGGHKAAAGFTIYASMKEAIEQVTATLFEALSKKA